VDAARALEAYRAAQHPIERAAIVAANQTELDALAAAGQARAVLAATESDSAAAESAFATDGVTWSFVQEARGHVEQAKVRLHAAEASREAAQTAVKALARARYQAAAVGADPTAYRAAIREDLFALVALEREAA
jgi:hypothetical protein